MSHDYSIFIDKNNELSRQSSVYSKWAQIIPVSGQIFCRNLFHSLVSDDGVIWSTREKTFAKVLADLFANNFILTLPIDLLIFSIYDGTYAMTKWNAKSSKLERFYWFYPEVVMNAKLSL